MENVMLNSNFADLSFDEMNETDGGAIGIIAACKAIAAVGTALGVCYQAGVAVGKFIYNVTH